MQTYCQFSSTNHADIITIEKNTFAYMATRDELVDSLEVMGVSRSSAHCALDDYLEGFQPVPKGELAISCCTHVQ